MKTLRESRSLSLTIFLFFLCSLSVDAQGERDTSVFNDALMPAHKSLMATVGTGVPYIGIGELSYGISDKFSIGLLIGSTPRVPGYGIRIKSVLKEFRSGNRIYLKTPILYYPQTRDLGGEPWVLTWPSLNYEKKFKSGVRLGYGIGMVAAACFNDLIGKHNHEPKMMDNQLESSGDHIHDHSHDHDIHQVMDEGFMGDIWNTVQTSVSVPVSKKLIFQAEFGLVLDGYKLADEAWVGEVPFVLFLGVSYKL